MTETEKRVYDRTFHGYRGPVNRLRVSDYTEERMQAERAKHGESLTTPAANTCMREIMDQVFRRQEYL